jgi:hypothetical protein
MLILSFFINHLLKGQIRAITQDRKAVILKEDGTWEYTSVQNASNIKRKYHVVAVCEYLLNELDDVTGHVRKKTKSVFIGRTATNRKITFHLFRDGYQKGFVIQGYAIDLGCIAQYHSTVSITFEDGETLDFYSIGDTDCGNNLVIRCMFIYGEVENFGTPEEIVSKQEAVINKIETLSIEKIRIKGVKYYTDISKPYRISEYLHCLD